MLLQRYKSQHWSRMLIYMHTERIFGTLIWDPVVAAFNIYQNAAKDALAAFVTGMHLSRIALFPFVITIPIRN